MATPSNSFAWGLTFSSGGVINGDINPALSGQRSLERASFSFSSLSLVIASPPRREGKGGKGSRSADTRAIAWALHVPSLYGGPRGSAPLCPHFGSCTAIPTHLIDREKERRIARMPELLRAHLRGTSSSLRLRISLEIRPFFEKGI